MLCCRSGTLRADCEHCEPFGDSLGRILRYQTAFHRQFLSYIKTLAQLQEAQEERGNQVESARP